MSYDRERDARFRFSEHVQSIAFNLTLSRRMIGLLQTVRDYGFPFAGQRHEFYQAAEPATCFANGSHQYIKFVRALENRGLVVHHPNATQNEPTVTLSRSGALVCELLVEAGLMPDAKPVVKSQRKAVTR